MSQILEITKSTSHSARTGNIIGVNCIYETGCLPDGTPCVILKIYNPNNKNAGISQTLNITKETP